MRPFTWKLFAKFGKIGALGAGVAASVAGAVVVVKAASPLCQCGTNELQQKRFHIPGSDYPPFKKWNFNWDRMEPGEGGKIWSSEENGSCKCTTDGPQSKARRNIILIRHGQYNIDGLDEDDGHTLTPLGEEQAALIGKRLGSMGIKFTSIRSSGLIRAIQTAQIILDNMNNQENLQLKANDVLLNEGAPCIPEPPYRNPDLWNPEQRDVLVEGGRIETAFRKYFHRADPSQEQDSWEIIVCHGNVIRYFSCRALQFPPEGWIRISIDHCSMTRFTILPTGEVILRGLGDSGHIPHEKATVC